MSTRASAYDYLRGTLHAEPRRIVVYGWSLGSAVAVDLVSRVDEAAVILEGAPASLVAIGARRYPYFPIRLLIRNPFESILKIGKIGSPVLFLHSPEDAVIPFEEGRKLFDAAPSPKQFVEVSGGHVYSSEKDPRFFPAIRVVPAGTPLAPVTAMADPHRPLRDDVSMLGEMLGETLRAREGQALFETVERVRRIAKAARQQDSHALESLESRCARCRSTRRCRWPARSRTS